MSSFRITIDLSKASGTKLAHFQTIFRYSVPIYLWIYENGAKEFDPALSSLFHLDFTKLLGRLQAM